MATDFIRNHPAKFLKEAVKEGASEQSANAPLLIPAEITKPPPHEKEAPNGSVWIKLVTENVFNGVIILVPLSHNQYDRFPYKEGERGYFQASAKSFSYQTGNEKNPPQLKANCGNLGGGCFYPLGAWGEYHKWPEVKAPKTARVIYGNGQSQVQNDHKPSSMMKATGGTMKTDAPASRTTGVSYGQGASQAQVTQDGQTVLTIGGVTQDIGSFFNTLEAQINGINECGELQYLRQELVNWADKIKKSIEGQVSKLADEIADPPPTDIITFVIWFAKYWEKKVETIEAQIKALTDLSLAVTNGVEKTTEAVIKKAGEIKDCAIHQPAPPPIWSDLNVKK